MSDVQVSGSARRLADELAEDRIELAEHIGVRELLLDELDYARRIPMFEGRRPLYDSFSMPPGEAALLACFERPVQYEAELVRLQELTGARIVQRTAVFGQVGLFTSVGGFTPGRARSCGP